MLKLYVSTFNQNVKFSFLQLIEEIVLMLSGETLRENMPPYLFSRFVITTMKSDNYNWIETCLRIMQILVDKKVTSCNLALHREGIQDYLSVFADKDKFKELTGIQINDEEEKQPQKLEESDQVDVNMADLFGGDSDNGQEAKLKTLEEVQPKDEQDQPKEYEEVKIEKIETPPMEKIEEEVETKLEKLEEIQQEEKPKEDTKIEAVESELKDDKSKVEEEDKQEKSKESEPLQTPEKVNEEEKVKEEEKMKEEEKASSKDKPKIVDLTSDPQDVQKFKTSLIDDPSLSQKTSELKEQKMYMDDLKMAIKESMSDIDSISKELEDTVSQELSKEEIRLSKESQAVSWDSPAQAPKTGNEEYIDTSKKAGMSKRKLKKMFIKKAIQNLDDNLVGLEDVEGFDEGEIEKIKDIITKKKLLQQSKNVYNQEARKYSRDFIGMNTAPMYKNIVTISKKLLTAFEESLKQDFDKNANVLERLTQLSEEMNKESKSARKFNKEKTVKLFKELSSFFEGENNSTKITQYELCKSKLVHALHSYLSLPLIEEESKSEGKTEEKVSSESVEEYFTIMSRYMCLVDVFLENENNKLLKGLVSLFENSIKISFNNYYHQELMAYHDGVNLAYDLKKYSKRNKIQVVYEPNIEKKIKEEEAAEKGEIPIQKDSIRQFFKGKMGVNPPRADYDGEGFEDSDLLKSLQAPKMDKTVSKQEVTEKPLIEAAEELPEEHKSTKSKNEDLSITYLKRDALYKELKAVNVSVENASTIEVIKDFLRNKVNSKDNVKQLKTHANLGSISSQIQTIFDRARRHMVKRAAKGENSSDMQSYIAKLVQDTFNEPENADKLSETDKLLLIKDIETLLGRGGSSLKIFGDKNLRDTPATLTEVSKKQPAKTSEVKEEKKELAKEESNDEKLEKTPQIKDLPTISEDDTDVKLQQEKIDQEEETIDFASKDKSNWGFFGKLKQLFFKKSDNDDDYDDEEEEDEDENWGENIDKEEEQPKEQEKPKTEEIKSKDKKAPKEEEKKEKSSEENKFIDAPFELNNLKEKDDVCFEFYYNRTKISTTRTIYELINYQPTYRSISDPHIIYFRILDQPPTPSATPTDSSLKKESQLLTSIEENTLDQPALLSAFFKNYLSPYIHADPKKESPLSNNPYSYTQAKPLLKISTGPEEQRQISKKAVKILEALSYLLKNYQGVKRWFGEEEKDYVIDVSSLYKNLLDDYVQKLLFEPLNLVLDYKKHKSEELMRVFMGNPYLLGFETRVFFYKTAGFAFDGELHRTVHFLIQHLRKKYAGIQDQAVPKQSKDKVKIDRKNILESTVKLFTTQGRIKRKNFLEIEYCNEEGTGLGPTLEFYYLCSKEFRQLKHLWRETEDNSLFPAPLEIAAATYGEENVLKYFETMGGIISKALSDDRLTDLPFSQVFWQICTNEPMTFDHISKLDSLFGSSIKELKEYSMKKKNIMDNKDLDEHIKDRQLESCKLKNGATVEDLCLFFVIPGTEIDLKPKGKDIQVTEDNLNEYLDLLLDVMLNKSIQKQVEAFKKGFGRNMEYLKVFKPQEIELLVCGNNDDDQEWTVQNLKEHIIPAHGYHDNSKTYLDLIQYMSQLSKEGRRQFLTFVTGSPRLPLGGFKNLKPKMNIVRKNEGSANPNVYLPSVMTCQNFLKIPEYSTYEILAERFDIASCEGQESFTLS